MSVFPNREKFKELYYWSFRSLNLDPDQHDPILDELYDKYLNDPTTMSDSQKIFSIMLSSLAQWNR
jgi:hypothetical protein